MISIRIIKAIFLGIFFLIFSIGCSTVKVPIAVIHPAEICMTKYKQIAIADIDGNLGQAFGDEIKNKLVESDRFDILDRNHTNQIMTELNMSQSDLSDSNKRLKLGKLLPASAIIRGHTEGKYKETLTYSNQKCGSKKEGYYNCKYYTRKGVYTASGSIDVVDVETGQIIRSKLLNASRSDSNSATDAQPAPIDKDSLKSSALSSNVNTFLKSIAPWTEIVQVPFVKNSDIPDLERGINQMKIGDSDNAIKTFANAAKAAEGNPEIDSETLAEAYFNLGLAYNCSCNHDAAIDTFKKAYAISPDADYITWMKTAEIQKKERKKLEAQGELSDNF